MFAIRCHCKASIHCKAASIATYPTNIIYVIYFLLIIIDVKIFIRINLIINIIYICVFKRFVLIYRKTLLKVISGKNMADYPLFNN